MSAPNYSYVMPVQRYMLMLAAIYIPRYQHSMTDQDYVDLLVQARVELMRITGRDFGYSIRQWHEYIMTRADLIDEYLFDDTDECHLYDDILAMDSDAVRDKLIAEITDRS